MIYLDPLRDRQQEEPAEYRDGIEVYAWELEEEERNKWKMD